MTKTTIILPMRPRRIVFLVYEGFELLDVSGPSAVFATANGFSEKPQYEIVLVSPTGGRVTSGPGPIVVAQTLHSVRPGRRDTVLAVGGGRPALEQILRDEATLGWLGRSARNAARYGSICTGTFLLASAGLLDGKRAATHWVAGRPLQKLHPSVRVERDALYVVDGPSWTSAGVSTGIDMALAMVHADLGASIMHQVAKQLVVYVHRPGNQSQFSALLDAQSIGGDAFSDVLAWIDANLEKPIRVRDMARRAAMSERTFYRRFTEMMGLPPSKYLEHVRLDRARELLEAGAPVKQVVDRVGYGSEQGFRAAFVNRFDISPSIHRQMHASS